MIVMNYDTEGSYSDTIRTAEGVLLRYKHSCELLRGGHNCDRHYFKYFTFSKSLNKIFWLDSDKVKKCKPLHFVDEAGNLVEITRYIEMWHSSWGSSWKTTYFVQIDADKVRLYTQDGCPSVYWEDYKY